MPNAEIINMPCGSDNTECLVAAKPIASGEEVFIEYSPEQATMTRKERRAWLLRGWQFRCNCKLCAADFDTRQLSDARRNILSILIPLVLQPGIGQNEGMRKKMLMRARGKMDPEVFNQWQINLEEDWERTTCALNILLANFLEAEGLLGPRPGAPFREAGYYLLQQIMSRNDRIVLVGAAQNAVAWLKKARQIRGALHREDAVKYGSICKWHDKRMTTFELRIAQDFVS